MTTRQPFRNSVRLLGLSAVFIGALASPTFALTLNVTCDTYTDNQSQSHLLPLGATPVINIGNVRGRNQAGFVRFDLAPLSKNSTITQAFLRLCLNEVVNLVGTAATITINGARKEGTLISANIPPTVPDVHGVGRPK